MDTRKPPLEGKVKETLKRIGKEKASAFALRDVKRGDKPVDLVAVLHVDLLDEDEDDRNATAKPSERPPVAIPELALLNWLHARGEQAARQRAAS